MPAGALIKAYPGHRRRRHELRLVLVRGDHRVNDIKLGNALGAAFRPAQESEFADADRPRGLHRPGRHRRADPARLRAATATRYITGANKADAHLRGVKPGRDFAVHRGRRAHGRGRRHRRRARDPDRARDRDRQHLQARHALLGAARARPTSTRTATRSRSGWAPTASARRGSPPPRSSSSPTRRASPGRARWRRSTSTSSASASRTRDEHALAERLYEELRAVGLDVIYDDRDLGPGAKFADAELLGVPAAADGRPPDARGGRGRGPGPARARDPVGPARGRGAGGQGLVGDAPVSEGRPPGASAS